MREKLGIIVNNLGPNQLAYYLINTGNKFVNDGEKDLTLFFHDLMPECANPLFGIMNLAEVYSYNGPVVATNINNASRLLEYPGPSKKVFYVWDLEWLRMPNKQYEQLNDVYGKIPLIARSKRHYDILSNAWQQPIGIVEDADVNKLYELAKV